ncbi:hypothetical protein Golax_025471 [Gossypium laxum]|uniref:Protein FAR1-RELATED SEQUENCE n=1 Tax=Gossypium laxum TaxID=34288 RepID=A0A7J9B417_9ROSI|nr:hypothetical protein [Gossypium laxum]
MGNHSPKTIMIDHDHAISKEIGENFHDSCHRLCLWYISRTSPSHLGNLNRNADFLALFRKFMQGCEFEIKFEKTW